MKQKTNDLRSPLAKARDKWLAGEEGQKCSDPDILRNRAFRQFLENRLVLAFLAGVKAGQKIKPT